MQFPESRRIAITSGFKFLSAGNCCYWKTHNRVVKELKDVKMQLCQVLSPELLSAVVQYTSKSQAHTTEMSRKRILRKERSKEVKRLMLFVQTTGSSVCLTSIFLMNTWMYCKRDSTSQLPAQDARGKGCHPASGKGHLERKVWQLNSWYHLIKIKGVLLKPVRCIYP